MTSNKYQKANETIKLSEAQKAAITENVLNAEIKPVRKGIPGWGWAGIAAFGFILVFALVLPVRPTLSGSAPAAAKEEASGTSADSYGEMIQLYEEESVADQAVNESMEESVSLSKAELENRFGHSLPDFESLSVVSHVEYRWVSEETAEVLITAENAEILIRITSEEYLADSSANDIIIHEGLGYHLVYDEENREPAEEIKALILGEQK